MNSTIGQILDEMRSGKTTWDTEHLTERLIAANPKPNASDLWLLVSQLREESAGKPAIGPKSPFDIFRQVSSLDFLFENFFGALELQQPLPGIVMGFAADYLAPMKPKRLLNPWASEPVGIADLLNAMPSLQEATALAPNAASFWRSRLFCQMAARIYGQKKTTEWRVAEYENNSTAAGHDKSFLGGRFASNLTQTLAGLQGAWDMIICFPPMGGNRDTSLLVIESAATLSPDGAGLFIVPPAFFLSGRHESPYAKLGRRGLAIEAVLSIPPEHRGNVTGVDLALIVVKKGVQEPLFVGELQTDTDRRKLLLKNLGRKQEAKDFALGMLVEKEAFQSFQILKGTREYKTLLDRQGLPVMNLADLLVEAIASKRGGEPSFPERANALYLPTIGFSEAVTSKEHFRLKPHNYLQLVLKPELVNAGFLAKFLNSEVGLSARRGLLSGNYISKISVGAVRRGIPIPLPALSVQSSVIGADTDLRDLATSVENLRKQLWERPAQVEKIRKNIKRVNREETFEDWLKTLPFPLASILWNYHTAAHEPKEQFELLLKFFEGLAEFNAMILLSAARRDAALWDEIRVYLAKERERFELSSFATWTELIAVISKRLRELWNDIGKIKSGDNPPGRARCEAALGTSRSEVIEAMLSKQMLGVLISANQFRNNYAGHYGVLGEETAANLLVQLRSYLSEVRSSFGQAWESYQLLLPTNRSEWTGQHHEVVVHVLQGLNTPFLKETRRLSEPLKRSTLYLLAKDRDRAIELLPLVKISHAPQDAANACYFYNRKQPNGARYVSYHFEKEADKTFPVAEVEQLFRDLFGTGGQP